MAVFSIAKEIHRLGNRLGKLSQNQARIVDFGVEKGNSSYLKVEIIPCSGYYTGGKVVFKVIWCCTNIYHTNIDGTDTYSDSNVCLNMFESDGSRVVGRSDGFRFEGNAADPCNGLDNNIEEECPPKVEIFVNKDGESSCEDKEETVHYMNEDELDVLSCIQYAFVPMDEGNFQEICVKSDSKRTTKLCISCINCNTETEQRKYNQTGKTISCKEEIQNPNIETVNRIATAAFTETKDSIPFFEQSEHGT
ncbi:hypothetical protein ACJMK2_030936 [Sinanodonta woodiana]|uniref:Uncharacterized protein n=1 Tax=Sinanodonta woodiana TaxID=1069815 RepID=A0ABD3WXA9_SINWO